MKASLSDGDDKNTSVAHKCPLGTEICLPYPACDSRPRAMRLTLNCPLQCATLTLLLDHLSLVASLQDSNKMTCQNLAVCFGPVLLGQKQEASQSGSRTSCQDLTSAVDFKMHIEVLHYLLQLWPSKIYILCVDKQSGLVNDPRAAVGKERRVVAQWVVPLPLTQKLSSSM
eukprot:g38954.t1